ncbi:hypothetical protein [Amycolatopsis sp.]|jgi:hypothetical protein|uniref:hypothetical protein n=1 Tax=Amycolatopsis sp. TaxID=37632 RepID=UPI002E0087D8|nr:hypothetical protein [Amycolatopsis sp.]
MTVMISIRWYGEDQQAHAYAVGELADDWAFAEPLCAPWEHAIPHPRRSLSSRDLPSLGGMCDRCPSCATWTRTHEHTVVVRGEPVAVAGRLNRLAVAG